MTNAVDLHRQYEEAMNAADLDAMSDLFDVAARVHLPDGAIVAGRDAVRQVHEALFTQDHQRFRTRLLREGGSDVRSPSKDDHLEPVSLA